MKRKTIVALEFVFLVVAIALILLARNKFNENKLITNDNITLATISGNAILIDENPEFNSAIKLKKNSTIFLEPGTYYFKESGFLGLFKNRVKKFTISSRVVLDLIEKNVSLEIMNTGNVPVNLTRQNESTEILDIGDTAKIARNESVEGKQK